jgi:energy-coupling factor transporter ATP-binding protein EcfA2
MQPICLPDSKPHLLLENGNVCIAFEQCERSAGISDRLIDFLAPSFQITRADLHPDFSIVFEPYELFLKEFNYDGEHDLVIRRSTAEMFNLTANVLLDNLDTLVVHDPDKKTSYKIERENKVITAYVSDLSFIHLVELIRYTSLIIEEARGAILLHASAAIADDEAVLVLGHKGAGKTTTLLRLLLGGTLDYLSGDKVLLNATAEGMTIRAWPDYPHIGIGSLRPYPAFAAACGVQFVWGDGSEKPDSHKELIDPHRFRSALPGVPRRSCTKVRALLFPDIASTDVGVRKFTPEEQSLDVLLENIEFPFEFTPGRWHGLFDDIMRKDRTTDDQLLRRLAGLPWYSVRGAVPSPLPEKSL